MSRRTLHTLSVLLALHLGGVAYATPTGLNNIPTANVVDQSVLVVQAFSSFASDRSPEWFAGLKYGAAANWEVGVDHVLSGPGSSGGLAFQAKYRMPLTDRARLGLGVANISSDREALGNSAPYVVLSLPLGALGGHLGHGWQEGNHAWFVGADCALSPALSLRADWTEVDGGEESVASLGFVTALSERWVIEGWASFPSQSNTRNNCILKANYITSLGGK